MTNRLEFSAVNGRTTREDLVALLNEDLAREYKAIISNVVYSQVIKGAEYVNIAAKFGQYATEKLAHALLLAEQIDYLGGVPDTRTNPVQMSSIAAEMLHLDLQAETEMIQSYRQRVRQCEALGEYAIGEHIRDILVQEQDHQVELARTLGIQVPNVTRPHAPLDEHSRINAGLVREM